MSNLAKSDETELIKKAIPENFNERVVEIARSFIGKKEISGNKGWNDKKFQRLMELCGWETSQAWCAYFVELVYKLAVEQEPEKWPKNPFVVYLNKLHSAGAVKTYDNFAGTEFFTATKIPEPGSLICYRKYINGQPSWQGHIGIVEKYQNNSIYTFEGNTNSSGGREGIEVGYMKRKLDFDIPEKGVKLVLLGFIKLK